MQTDEGRLSKRGRFMGKLFGNKEKKNYEGTTANNLDSFLHTPADNLQVTHPPPPPPPSTLPKLDTTISRYPQALAVNQQAQLNRVPIGRPESRSPIPRSPRPNKKGLFVQFSDARPDIIGEGGDECEAPVSEISRRKLARSPQPPPQPRQGFAPPTQQHASGPPPGPAADDFVPKRLARTQTGYSSIYSPEETQNNGNNMHVPPQPPPQMDFAVHAPHPAATMRQVEQFAAKDEQRRSFIEIQQAQMRRAEGQAFAKAARTASVGYDSKLEDGAPPPTTASAAPSAQPMSPQPPQSPELHDHEIQRQRIEYSPAASLTSLASSTYPPSAMSPEPPSHAQFGSPGDDARQLAARMASVKLSDAFSKDGDDALQAFVERTMHLHELFRLHAETIKPLQSCTVKELARAALWWFLKGRMGLEVAVREKPSTPQSQMQNDLDRQQAYSNLSKGNWLCQDAIPEVAQLHHLPPDPEVLAVTEQLISALRKLSMSMQRNGFLPPEEQFLPQTIDKSVWVEYPPISQDMEALLSGNWGSGISAMQRPITKLQLLDAFPLADTTENFSYGRVPADVYLMEQDRESQRFHFPSLLSMVRPQRENGLVFIIASQNGCMQLAIQDNKNVGPVWEAVRWRNDMCSLELRLPRGFMVAVQLSQNDYRMLWNMYDYGFKVRSTLQPRTDELVIFRNTLRSFQYIDADLKSRAFPKEAIPQCEVALFEKIRKEPGPAGQRNWHSGFRLAAVTGPRTRTVCGVHHTYLPILPVQFGFFRAEDEAPALSIKFENTRQRGRMVLVFSDEKERIRFHSLITGTDLDVDERIFANVPLKSFTVAQSLREPTGMAPFSRMPWKSATVINDDFSANGDIPHTVLADKLKVVLDYQNGMVTDRINVAPGEMRLRLEVTNAKVLRVMRQPQQDMTISVSEAQVPKELPMNMADALNLVRSHQTIRTMEFNNLKDMHDFQCALTGFEVVFDALAVTFAISRRRMVVPIHKKWEAGFTRIQVVRQADKQMQLLAFFEDFQHGHCMNFVLKGTDVYETFHRSGKAGVKFVDAKFPLPRMPEDKDGDFDDMAFVCLDLPDLPGEHDDISILFENEAGTYTHNCPCQLEQLTNCICQ